MVTKKLVKPTLLVLSSVLLLTSCMFLSTRAPEEIKAIIAETSRGTNSYTAKDLAKNQGYNYLPSTGDQSVLVLPIQFSDNQPTGVNIAKFTTDLETAFNGTKDEAYLKQYPLFLSVKDFYEQSSYGKLGLDFVVPQEIYTAPRTQLEYCQKYTSNSSLSIRASNEIIQSAYDDYVLSSNDTKQYNSVIGIYYSDYNQFNERDQELFWAYTCNFSENEKPYDNYIWASYYFLFEVVKFGLDTHTYIHEFGHLLGIDDYYNYDDSYKTAAGVLDTMVANVGDHNAYSKYLLGWIDPITPKSSGKIELKPYATSGDALIVGSDWNGTAYDEYLILTYYTPTGLYERDTKYPKYNMYETSGILVYQVDSRLGQVFANGNVALLDPSTIDGFKEADKDYVIFHSNTPSYNYSNNKTSFLLEIKDARGRNYAVQGYIPAESTLFKAGTAFGVGKYTTFTFHDSSKLDYNIYIDSFTQPEGENNEDEKTCILYLEDIKGELSK